MIAHFFTGPVLLWVFCVHSAKNYGIFALRGIEIKVDLAVGTRNKLIFGGSYYL